MGIITFCYFLCLFITGLFVVGPKLDIVRDGSIIFVLELLLDFILYIDLTIIWFCLGISTVGNDNRIYVQLICRIHKLPVTSRDFNIAVVQHQH